MKRILYAMCVLAAACRGEDKNVTKRLDDLERRVALIERRPAAPAPRPRPDANAVYFVPIDDGDTVRGAKHAKVTVVEAFDFACPYCARSTGVVEGILAKYKDTVRVVSKQLVVHADTATLPALAVCAAAAQGKAAELEKAVWAAAWQTEPRPQFDPTKLAQPSLEELAKSLGLDVGRFRADLGSDRCKASIERQKQQMNAIGVSGTPAFFVNGRPFQGPRTIEAFAAVIDAEIEKADAAVKSGVKLEEYYATLMASAKKTR